MQLTSEAGKSILNYFGDSIYIFSLIIQLFYAVMSLNKGLQNNNLKIFLRYYFSKIFYTLCLMIEGPIFNIIRCSFPKLDKPHICFKNRLIVKLLLEFLWVISQFYFIFILFLFYWKTKMGHFGVIGSEHNPNFLENFFNIGKIKEVKGQPIGSKLNKENSDFEIESEIEIGILIIDQNPQNSLVKIKKNKVHPLINESERSLIVLFIIFN